VKTWDHERKTPKNSWCGGFVSEGVHLYRSVICMKQQMKAHHEHKKTHDLINKKGSFDRESLVAL
jgi:hypothetical protein